MGYYTYRDFNYSTSSTSTSTTSALSENWIDTPCLDSVKMSREDMASNNKKSKKKQSGRKENFRSEIMTWFNDNIILNSTGIHILFHSPMYMAHNNALLKDFHTLLNLGYSAHVVPASNHIVYDPHEGQRSYTTIFIDGVLEHMPGIMSQALFLKKVISKLHSDKRGYVVLHTKTRKQVDKEAKRNNYPKDGRGYLITLPDRKQSRIEGIDDDEVKTLLAYGKIYSIFKTDTLSKVKGSHIILWNGA